MHTTSKVSKNGGEQSGERGVDVVNNDVGEQAVQKNGVSCYFCDRGDEVMIVLVTTSNLAKSGGTASGERCVEVVSNDVGEHSTQKFAGLCEFCLHPTWRDIVVTKITKVSENFGRESGETSMEVVSHDVSDHSTQRNEVHWYFCSHPTWRGSVLVTRTNLAKSSGTASGKRGL